MGGELPHLAPLADCGKKGHVSQVLLQVVVRIGRAQGQVASDQLTGAQERLGDGSGRRIVQDNREHEHEGRNASRGHAHSKG